VIALFHSQRVHQLIDRHVDAETGRERQNDFGPGRLVKESEGSEAADRRVGLVDQILEPAKSPCATRRRDTQAPLHEAVRQLGKAVSNAQSGA
jgi:hypothetical protein